MTSLPTTTSAHTTISPTAHASSGALTALPTIFLSLSRAALEKFQQAQAGSSEDVLSSWKSLLELATSLRKDQPLDREILSRIQSSDLLQNIQFPTLLEKIFHSEAPSVDIFLKLATTYKISYYTNQELLALIQEYAELLDKLLQHNIHLSSMKLHTPCYDQGGKNWLHSFLKTVSQSKLSQQHIRALTEEGPQFFCKKVVKLDTPPPKLEFSAERYFTTASLHHDIQELLNQALLSHKVSEAECLQIIHILLSFLQPIPSVEDQKALVFWLMTIKHELGDGIFVFLANQKSYRHAYFDQTLSLLKLIIELSAYDCDLVPYLFPFFEEKIQIQNLIADLGRKKAECELNKYPEKSLAEVVAAFQTRNPSSRVEIPLPPALISVFSADYGKIASIGETLRHKTIDELCAFVQNISSKKRAEKLPLAKEEILAIIAAAREAIRLQFGIYLYNTQIFALLGILSSPPNLKGRIAQVQTGEGKSTIITMLGLILAIQGLTVDVVSSSRYLAQRDQQKYQKFFQSFGITSSHICTDTPTAENFSGQVLYGTNYDLEFAFMRENLFNESLRTWKAGEKIVSRPFNAVIVDEVDNLFMDTAQNSARIAIKARLSHKWVYEPILDFVSIHKEEIAASFLQNSTATKDLIKILQIQLLKDLRSFLFSVSENKQAVELLDDEQLTTWLKSAYQALFVFRPDQDYVIKSDDPLSEKTKEIVIVDKKITGRLLEKCRWNRGIHEFVEAKHHLPIQEETSMPASLSHPVYFGYYARIYGFSGTMGIEEERAEIEETYTIDTFDAPLTGQIFEHSLIPYGTAMRTHLRRPFSTRFKRWERKKDQRSFFLRQLKTPNGLLDMQLPTGSHADF